LVTSTNQIEQIENGGQTGHPEMAYMAIVMPTGINH
jgi:hypothetical protein